MFITVQIEDVAISLTTNDDPTPESISAIKNQVFDLWKKVRLESESETEEEMLDNGKKVN